MSCHFWHILCHFHRMSCHSTIYKNIAILTKFSTSMPIKYSLEIISPTRPKISLKIYKPCWFDGLTWGMPILSNVSLIIISHVKSIISLEILWLCWFDSLTWKVPTLSIDVWKLLVRTSLWLFWKFIGKDLYGNVLPIHLGYLNPLSSYICFFCFDKGECRFTFLCEEIYI